MSRSSLALQLLTIAMLPMGATARHEEEDPRPVTIGGPPDLFAPTAAPWLAQTPPSIADRPVVIRGSVEKTPRKPYVATGGKPDPADAPSHRGRGKGTRASRKAGHT